MKHVLQVIIVLLFFLTLIFTSVTNASEYNSIEELLEFADRTRSSEPKKFLSLIKEINERRSELTLEQNAFLNYFEGYAKTYSGDQQGAIDKYIFALQNTQNKELIFRLSLSMAITYSIMRNWTQGLISLERALLIESEIERHDIRIQGSLGASIFYNQLGKYRLALTYVNKLNTEHPQGRNRCIGYQTELEAKVKLNEINADNHNFEHGAEYCLQISEPLVAYFIYIHQIQSLIAEERYVLAAEQLNIHLQPIINTNYKRLIAEAFSLRAVIFVKLSRIDLARNDAEKALEYSKGSEFSLPIMQALEVLFEVNMATSDFETAIKFQQRHAIAERGYLDDQMSKQLAYQSAKMDLLAKTNQISSLNQLNQILRLEQNLAIKAAQANRWIIGLLGLSVSLMVLWSFYIKRSQQRLKYLAEYDGLTRICNRTHFTESASTILKAHSKSKVTVSLIMFDLDHFKKVNDSFGHLTGDKVLQLAAHACSGCVRKADIFGRIGGEEFAVILPGCESEQAMKIAEDCRQKLNQIDFQQIGCDINVSASFGVAETKSSGYELKNLLAHADKAMYQAKQNGRNQVMFWKDALA